MNNEKKIIFTENAKNRLRLFHDVIDEQLLEYFRNKNFVLGDDSIEVTAADIDEASDRFKLTKPTQLNIKKLIPVLYFIIGTTTSLVGVYYGELVRIIEKNPMQFAIIMSGTLTALSSWFYLYIIKIKEQQDERKRHQQRKNNDDET